MLAVPVLQFNNMSRPYHASSFGRQLKQLREDAKGSSKQFLMSDVAEYLGLSQPTISNIENGKTYAEDAVKEQWSSEKQFNLLKAYKLTDDEVNEFSRKYGLSAHLMLRDKALGKPLDKTVPIRHLGVIQAGRFGNGYVNDGVEYVDVIKSFLGHYSPEDCFALDVNGDSMICDVAGQSIPEGSTAVFVKVTKERQPVDGQIIAAWLKSDEVGVIKIFHKKPDFAILNSFNKAHKPIVLDERNQGTPQGIYLGHWSWTPITRSRRG
jgi:SOS-response transcriptional repressor LexA